MATKTSPITALKKLQQETAKLAKEGSKAFYRIAKNIKAIQDNPAWAEMHNGDEESMNAEIDSYINWLPGANRAVVRKMFELYPNESDWTEQDNVHAIWLEARAKLNPRSGKTIEKKAPIDEAEIKPSNPNNLGGGWGGLTKENVVTLLAENEHLKRQVQELNAKLVEVMLERDQLRASLAKAK